MSIDKFVPFALGFVLLASIQKPLPEVTNSIRRAMFNLIQSTKASSWPKAPLLPRR